MKTGIPFIAVAVIIIFSQAGCDGWFSADKKGEIKLSSQKLGTDSYYLMGFHYEEADYFRFPSQFQSDPEPDIINEEYRIIEKGEVISLPGFNTPSSINGFSIVGEFATLESARKFYNNYSKVEQGLQFETVSDTVELFQVWVQKTKLGNYVKLFVKDIGFFEDESGNKYNEVTVNYTYQSDGSTTFPD